MRNDAGYGGGGGARLDGVCNYVTTGGGTLLLGAINYGVTITTEWRSATGVQGREGQSGGAF